MSAYRISVTAGHLTAVNKRDISHMLEHGMTSGKTRAGIAYSLSDGVGGEGYSVRIAKTETDDWGRLVEAASRAAFTATRVKQ